MLESSTGFEYTATPKTKLPLLENDDEVISLLGKERAILPCRSVM